MVENEDAPVESSKSSVPSKTKEDTPDPRRKNEFVDENRSSKRQLLVELRKELITNENKSTQYSIDDEKVPESASKVIEKKVKSVTVKTSIQPERQSVSSNENGEDSNTMITVKASIHSPPKRKSPDKVDKDVEKLEAKLDNDKVEVEIVDGVVGDGKKNGKREGECFFL